MLDRYVALTPHRPPSAGDVGTSILDLLHPAVTAAAYGAFRAGRYRDSVLNAITAVFDLLRARSGLDRDGADLVAEAPGFAKPLLVILVLGGRETA